LHQGFDYYDDDIPSVTKFINSCATLSFINLFLPIDDYLSSRGHNGYKTTQQINDYAFTWLEGRDQDNPFFLMLHYFDAHHPYFPEKIGMGSVPAFIRSRYTRCTNYVDLEKKIIDSVISGRIKLRADEKDFLIQNYDREITLLDQKIGALLSYLKEKTVYDKSIIIILSDHGESFGEHNLMLHGLSLYEDNLRVPLIIKYPLHCRMKGTVDYPVSLTGVAPTVLSCAAIPIPDFMQGSPLSEPQNQKLLSMLYYAGGSQWVLPEALQCDQTALLAQNYKLIQFGNGQKQLYDLNIDPDETNNIMSKEEAAGAGLLADMTSHIKKYTAHKTTGSSDQTIDKEAIQNLRNLGYVK